MVFIKNINLKILRTFRVAVFYIFTRNSNTPAFSVVLKWYRYSQYDSQCPLVRNAIAFTQGLIDYFIHRHCSDTNRVTYYFLNKTLKKSLKKLTKIGLNSIYMYKCNIKNPLELQLY